MSPPRADLVAPAALAGKPRWLLCLALAAATTALFCAPVWPGYMSYDSLMAYDEGLYGVWNVLWPPLHAYLFALSHAAGADGWGLFLAQTFAIFLGANLAISLMAGSAIRAGLLMLAFVASFVAIPSQMGVLFVQWRDVTTTSAAVLGLGLWMLAARRRRPPLLVGAALAFGAAVALRYNALPLVVFLSALMIWRPWLDAAPAGAGGRTTTIAATVLALGLAWASVTWRLPDLQRMPAAQNLSITQAFDLIGVSACADEDDLPLEMTGGAPMSGRQIRQNYDPRHLNLSLAPKPGVRPFTSAKSQAIGAAWSRAVRRHPGCYLAHRTLVFVEQMGLARGELFYPTHGGIDPNPYGLKLAHPAASARLTAYVNSRAPELWRRPILLYVGAAAATAWALARRRVAGLLAAALFLGALAYAAGLFVAGPAADARYIFPSNTFCALAIVLVLAAAGRDTVTGR